MALIYNKLGSIYDIETGKKYDSDGLQKQISSRSNSLGKAGLKPNDIILLVQNGTPDFFADLLALWTIGVTVAVLNPNSKYEEFQNIVRHLSPKLALIGDKKLPELEKTGVPVWSFSTDKFETITITRKKTDTNIDNQALILFTSGTTGVPKGVSHSYRSLLSRISLNYSFMGAPDLERSLCALPVHFGHGLIGNCLTPLLNGSDLILLSNTDMKSLSQIGLYIDEYAITFLSSVPSFWKVVHKLSKRPTKNSLKRIHVGSAPLSSKLWNEVIDWANIRNVNNMYGITETANWIGGASAIEFKPRDGLIGRLWGGSAAVYTDDNKIQSKGYGEILILTPSIMTKYVNLPSETKNAFIGQWYRTGDHGFIDDEKIVLVGRKKEEVNRAGIKIQPADIDILLERHPAVKEACAFKIEDTIKGEDLAVAISMKMRAEITDIKKWCAERIVSEKLPSKWYVLDRIPKTDRGKVNRTDVAKRCLNTNK